MIEVIHPDNKDHWLKLRVQDITSTEVSALFNCSPYLSHYELWHLKKTQIVPEFQSSERMEWGLRLESAIAQGLAEDSGLDIVKAPGYIRNPELRMGSSFDYFIGNDGILEIKNVDGLQFRDKWLVDCEDIEAPPHIELQVQHQLAVTGRNYAMIGALIGGNKLIKITRNPDENIIRLIKEKVQSFWASIDANEPPHPDFAKDASFIFDLYSHAEPGKNLDARDDMELYQLAERYREMCESIKTLDQEKDSIKAQILARMGDAEKVIGQGFSISASVVGDKLIEPYVRKGFRSFRVNWRKS